VEFSRSFADSTLAGLVGEETTAMGAILLRFSGYAFFSSGSELASGLGGAWSRFGGAAGGFEGEECAG